MGLAPEIRDTSERNALVQALLSAFESAARAERCGLIAVKDISAPRAGLWGGALEEIGFHAIPGLPLADLDIDFPDIDTYLARLSSATRKGHAPQAARRPVVAHGGAPGIWPAWKTRSWRSTPKPERAATCSSRC
ncbi:hypothetical protein ACRAWD_15825 [Caulobacter segnis]